MSTSRRDFLKQIAVMTGAVMLSGPSDALEAMERNVPVTPMNPKGLNSEKFERARKILNQPQIDPREYVAVVHPKTMRQLAFEDQAWEHLKTKPNLNNLFVEHLQDCVRPQMERSGLQIPVVSLRMPGMNPMDTLDHSIVIQLRAYKSQWPLNLVRIKRLPPEDLQVIQNQMQFSTLYRASRETVEHMAWSVEDMAADMITKFGDPVA